MATNCLLCEQPLEEGVQFKEGLAHEVCERIYRRGGEDALNDVHRQTEKLRAMFYHTWRHR